MEPLITSAPVLAISALYCVWNAWRVAQLRRERRLRERVAYLLWVLATEVE